MNVMWKKGLFRVRLYRFSGGYFKLAIFLNHLYVVYATELVSFFLSGIIHSNPDY